MAGDTKGFHPDMDEENDEEDDESNWEEVQNYPRFLTTHQGIERPRMESFAAPEVEKTSLNLAGKASDGSENMEKAGPSRMSLNDHKAGMEGLDKEKINKIIYEASKGSKFYENELKKEKLVNERIARQCERLEACSEQDKVLAMIEADNMVRELESSRDLSRTIVHIDMDAFYAAVEMRDNPSLKDKPMAVGSTGMLCTSNYPARRYGVRAAMPGFIGKKLCPDLILVPLHFEKYREVSKVVRGIFADYDPSFLPMSLDEAYLDLTDCLQERKKMTEKRVFYQKIAPESKQILSSDKAQTVDDQVKSENKEEVKFNKDLKKVEFGNDVEEIVKEIRFRIENDTQLTASAGIACNSMLAKVCTDRNKPNGQYYLKPDREEICEFVRSLPIRKISGIGRVSEQMLKALGITSCEDIYNKRDILVLANSEISARFLIGVSLGLGATRLESDRDRKSLSTERTFSEISHPAQLYTECEKLCHAVFQDMIEEDLKPKTVTLKLKTVDFQVKTRASSLANPITSVEEILTCAKDILSKAIKACEPKPLRLRLMGVRLSNFQSNSKAETTTTITSFFTKKSRAQNMDQPESSSTQGVGSASGGSDEANWLMSSSSLHPDISADDVDDKIPDENTTKDEKGSTDPNITAICPVCNKVQKAKEADFLMEFNKHVDLCLNSIAIKEALSENQQGHGCATPSTAGKKPTHSSPGKGLKGGKRKQNTKDLSVTKKRTLETFWSKK